MAHRCVVARHTFRRPDSCRVRGWPPILQATRLIFAPHLPQREGRRGWKSGWRRNFGTSPSRRSLWSWDEGHRRFVKNQGSGTGVRAYWSHHRAGTPRVSRQDPEKRHRHAGQHEPQRERGRHRRRGQRRERLRLAGGGFDRGGGWRVGGGGCCHVHGRECEGAPSIALFASTPRRCAADTPLQSAETCLNAIHMESTWMAKQ